PRRQAGGPPDSPCGDRNCGGDDDCAGGVELHARYGFLDRLKCQPVLLWIAMHASQSLNSVPLPVHGGHRRITQPAQAKPSGCFAPPRNLTRKPANWKTKRSSGRRTKRASAAVAGETQL